MIGLKRSLAMTSLLAEGASCKALADGSYDAKVMLTPNVLRHWYLARQFRSTSMSL